MAITSYRLLLAKNRILLGACRIAINGDSISSDGLTSRMFNGLYKTLTPLVMTGVCNTATMLGGGVGGAASYTDGKGAYTGAAVKGFGTTALGGIGGTPSGGTGDAAIAPHHFADSGTIASDLTTFTQTFDGAFPAANRSGCAGGDWMTAATTLRVFVYSTTLGLTTGFGRNVDRPIGNSINFANPDATGVNLSGHWTFIITAGSGATSVGWAMQATAEDETNKRIYVVGTRYTVSELGLELQACATGSSAIADHINAARCTQANLNIWVAERNTNTVYVHFGENEPDLSTPAAVAAWTADLLTLLGRWRTAILANGGSPLFLLVTQYETVSSTTPARVLTMANVQRQIAQQYADVCWFGLGLVAGSYATINGNGWLADGVHPSDSGALAFAAMINSALLAAIPDNASAALGIGNRSGRAARAARAA